MSGFDWSLIQSFLAVAQNGSFSGAARDIGQSQPTIGRHVERLQEQLGAVLFQRGNQGYDLTATGQALLTHAQAMQAEAANISIIAEGRSEEVRGTVRITASEIVATYILPGIIARLLAEEPELQVELVASNTNENLLQREADIAVRMVKPEQQDLIARKIGEIELGLFASQSYITRAGLPERIKDIGNHTLLGYDRSDLMIRGIAQFGLDIKREDFAFRVDDQVAYLEALRAGVGIGAAQKRQAEVYELVEVFSDLKIPSLPVWLAAHSELRTSARVRRVFDYLVDHLPEQL